MKRPGGNGGLGDLIVPTNQSFHEKGWGHELWIENCGEYCGKRLFFKDVGSRTSMHFHVKKLETMFVEKGCVDIELIEVSNGLRYTRTLYEGESLMIMRAQPHQIVSREDGTVVFEFSTHHLENDSFRVEPGDSQKC